MGTLKVGIVGAGRVADLHALGYRDNPKAEIAAVCDQSEDRAISRSLDWGADAYYTDYEEMLADADLDAVEVLTPNDLHYSHAVQALEAGKHVCLERPIATSIAEAEKLVQRAQATDLTVQVYEPCLFHKPMLDARNLIDADEIGEPKTIQMSANVATATSGTWDFDTIGDGRWRFDAERSGGSPLLFDVGYPGFCIALFLVGSVEKIEVWRSQTDVADGQKLDAPTTAIWKHFERNCLGTFSLNYTPERELSTPHHPLEFTCDLQGTKGDISIVHTPDPSRYDAAVQLKRDGRTILYSQAPNAFEKSFERATENFVDACLGETDPLLKASEAKQLLVLTLAFNESAKHSQSVSLKHG